MRTSLQAEIADKVGQLAQKFKNSGQDLGSYLDGLLHDRYLTYWDYIHLDTLLSLQVPKTHFPDEEIFITYHQITELYFKLILHELKQITDQEDLSLEFFTSKVQRVNRYFQVLIQSFDVMTKGMEKEQFLQYRMSLLPASGFQSVQFRLIEIYATPLRHLVHLDHRASLDETSTMDTIFEKLYWKFGATDIKTKEKTLTLKQFEERYTPRMLRTANFLKQRTIFDLFNSRFKNSKNNTMLVQALRTFDTSLNVQWSLMHLGAAYRFLNKKGVAVPASGGTNWKSFLPPRFQKISFFPNLWSKEEQENWGKEWVMEQLNKKNI